MGFFVLGYLALVAILGISSLLFLLIIVARHRQKSAWFNYGILLFITSASFIYSTWPFFIGRLIYEAQCSMSSGLSVKRTVDATTEGYLLYDPEHRRTNGAEFTYHAYAHQAVKDLITGRIAFFEGSASFSGGKVEFPYIRVFLSDKHNRLCRNYDDILQGINLPNGKCLASENIKTIESKYEVRGYESHSAYIPRSVQVTERKTGTILSTYNWFNLDVPLLQSHSCPKGSPSLISPVSFISTTVFKDRSGKTLNEADFDKLKKHASELKINNFREIPPREIDDSQKRSDFGNCAASTLGESFETHKISIQQGGGRVIKTMIDSSEHNVRVVRVIVNNPTLRTVLSLRSYEPVVWNISRTPNSEIAGIVVTGNHGQAVLGVDQKTPVMISTQNYSPGSNCSASEMRDIQQAISISVSKIETDKIALAVIGNPEFLESSLISSNERTLDSYAVR